MKKGSATNRANYNGKLRVEGSNDGTTWTTIKDIINIHEDWNYVMVEDMPGQTKTSYQQYRFFGTGAKACDIGEARFYGVIVKDDNSSPKECTPVLTIDSAPVALPNINKVVYENSATPALTSVSPRYGTVKGGTVVTFTGTNFPTTGTTTITLDGQDCPITGTPTST